MLNVSKITLHQRAKRCSEDILLTYNRDMPQIRQAVKQKLKVKSYERDVVNVVLAKKLPK